MITEQKTIILDGELKIDQSEASDLQKGRRLVLPANRPPPFQPNPYPASTCRIKWKDSAANHGTILIIQFAL